MWVAKAEGLLARLRESEAADRSQREEVGYWTNSLGMEFAWIPAGHFLMGSPGMKRAEIRTSDSTRCGSARGFG